MAVALQFAVRAHCAFAGRDHQSYILSLSSFPGGALRSAGLSNKVRAGARGRRGGLKVCCERAAYAFVEKDDAVRHGAGANAKQLSIAMKFGGSSVGSAERMREVADLILSFPEERPVIVLSAMGKTTNKLLLAGEKAVCCGVSSASEIEELSFIKELHLKTIDELGIDRSTISENPTRQQGKRGACQKTKKGQLSDKLKQRSSLDAKKETSAPKDGPAHIASQTFTFRELAAFTKNFRQDCLLGEGGFGRVYKGRLDNGQVIAVKQLDRNGLQGNREFLVEVLMLSLLHHPNLVNLIGYCADGDQRLLVYEFMPLGSLEDHLHDLPTGKEPLDWNIRMKIAAGAAEGLEYLHDKANPPVIYRDLKSSNILLGEGYHPKLSDFGLAKLGPVGDKTHVSTRVMGTYGYCAPEYAMTGQLTLKSDVYSFGVVFLELITGRKAIDNTRPPGEQNLVAWARPLFKDRRKFPKMADPLLQGRYPMRGLYQALAVAAMCLQEQAATRPLMADVVTALNYLANQPYDPTAAPPKFGRTSPSTPRTRENRRNLAIGGPDTQNAIHSPRRNSPRQRELRGMNLGGSAGSSDAIGDSGWKWGVEELEKRDSQAGSPMHAGKTNESPRSSVNRDLDRERLIAEAKVWGENWRERKRMNMPGSFDSSNE